MKMLEQLTARFGGDSALAGRALQMIRAQLPALQLEIAKALAEEVMPDLSRAAHDLKNALAYLGEQKAVQEALALEQAAERQAPMQSLIAHWQILEALLQDIRSELDAHA